jgi:hypothetical protein
MIEYDHDILVVYAVEKVDRTTKLNVPLSAQFLKKRSNLIAVFRRDIRSRRPGSQIRLWRARGADKFGRSDTAARITAVADGIFDEIHKHKLRAKKSCNLTL